MNKVAIAIVGLALAAALPNGLLAKTPADQLVIGMNMVNMPGLDPHQHDQFESTHVLGNLYDQLVTVDVDDTSRLLPLAAESWDVREDGTIAFRLRQGMTFHSGRPVTAEDVVWSWQRLMTLNSGMATHFKDMGYTADNIGEKARVEADGTLVLEPARSISAGLKLGILAKPSASILDRTLIEPNAKDGDLGKAWLATNSAGSGPFKLNRWQPNDIAVLERHEQYWAGAPKMQRILVRHIPESQTQRLQLERGDLDVGYSLSNADFEGLDRHPDVQVERVPGGGFYYLGLNLLDPDLAKRDVREALRWCIDFEGINQTLLQNYGRPWQRHVLPGLVGSLPDLEYRLDIDRCRAELAAAGYPNGLKKTLRAIAATPFAEIATAIQATMSQAGVELEILPGDGGQVYGAMRNRDFEMLVGRGGSGYIPHPHDTLQLTAYNPDNRLEAKLVAQQAWRASWSVPEVNELIERGVSAATDQEQEQIYHRVQELIEQEVSWAFPISQRLDPVAVHSRVQNYRGSPTWMVAWEAVDKVD